MFDVVAVTEPALIDAVYEDIPTERQSDLSVLLNAPTLREWQPVDAATQQSIMQYCAQLGKTYHTVAGEQLTNTLYNLAAISEQSSPWSVLTKRYTNNSPLARKLNLALVSKIGYDEAGRAYAQQLRNIGIDITHTPFAAGDTGLCLSLQFGSGNLSKAMFTRLCNFQTLRHRPLSSMTELCLQTRYLLIEGYLMSSEPDQVMELLQIAKYIQQHHQQNLMIGLTLSAQKVAAAMGIEPVRQYFDFIAANEEEFNALCGQTVSFEQLRDILDPQRQKILLYTRGKHGAILSRHYETEMIAAQALPPEKVIDVTGAGDAFLAGVLYGLLQQQPLRNCGKMGSAVASQIVQTRGARLNYP